MTANSELTGCQGDPDVTARDSQRIDHLVSSLQDVEGSQRDQQSGVFSERLEEIEPLLQSFCWALGGVVDDVSELPFTEEAGTDSMPEPLYVRHDEEMLTQITSWLLQGRHIGLISEYGTGKSAIREIARRDLGDREDFVVAHLDNPNATTERGLYELILRAAADEGYTIDEDNYWQVRDGIPWSTEETKQAVGEIATQTELDGTTVLLIVDEVEDLGEDLLAPLQTAADVGVRLFLTGTPEGKRRLQTFRQTLDSRVRYYEGIDPFGPTDIAEYVARSFAHMRGEPYDDQQPPLFTADAIRDIHRRTGGNPRAVRLECLDLFARAAFLWDRTDTDAERIRITPALRDRNLTTDEGATPAPR